MRIKPYLMKSEVDYYYKARMVVIKMLSTIYKMNLVDQSELRIDLIRRFAGKYGKRDEELIDDC